MIARPLLDGEVVGILAALLESPPAADAIAREALPAGAPRTLRDFLADEDVQVRVLEHAVERWVADLDPSPDPGAALLALLQARGAENPAFTAAADLVVRVRAAIEVVPALLTGPRGGRVRLWALLEADERRHIPREHLGITLHGRPAAEVA